MQNETRGQGGMREGGRAEGPSGRQIDRSETRGKEMQRSQTTTGQAGREGSRGEEQTERQIDRSNKAERGQAQRDQGRKDQTIGQGRNSEQTRKSEGNKPDATRQDGAQTRQQDQSKAATQNQNKTGADAQQQTGNQARQQQPDTATQNQGTTGAATQTQSGSATQGPTQNQPGIATQNQASQTTSQTTSASGMTLSAQQQTTIHQSVISASNAPRVNINSVNFAINTGVIVPSHVHAVSISAFPAMIDVFPQYRDYSFFVVEDEVVFLDRERRVVDVVPAGPRARFSSGGSGGGTMALNLSEIEIREVQRVLIDRGLLTTEADGVLGPRTREALITFQRQQGIQASGSIDTSTVGALGLSNRIQSGQNVTGSQSTSQSTSNPSTTTQGQVGAQQPVTQQNAAGQGSNQTNPPQQQSTTGQQPSAQNQPAQQNTTGQAAPQNQSAVGEGSNQPAANQNTQPGQTTGAAPSTSGQANPPAQNPDQNPNSK
jgi:hypothetical protein